MSNRITQNVGSGDNSELGGKQKNRLHYVITSLFMNLVMSEDTGVHRRI